jgi:hypothetical protein
VDFVGFHLFPLFDYNLTMGGMVKDRVSNHSRDKAQISDAQLPLLSATNALYGHSETTDKLTAHNLTREMIIRIMA